MDLQETNDKKIDNTANAAGSAANSSTPETESNDAPLRILDIIRGTRPAAKEEPAPPLAAPAPAPSSPPAPAPIRPKPASREPLEGPPTFANIDEAIKAAGAKSEVQKTNLDSFPAGNTGNSGVSVPTATHIARSESPAIPAAIPTPAAPAHPLEPLPDATTTPQAEEEEKPAPKKDPLIPAMRTLRDDMKEIVEGQGMSLVRASALEEAKKTARKTTKGEAPKAPRAGRRSGVPRLLGASLLLILLGGAAIGGFLFIRAQQQGPLDIANETPGLIFAEQTTTLPIERSTPAILRSTIVSARESQVGTPGAIVRILPTTAGTSTLATAGDVRVATAREFFASLNIALPQELSISLSDEFFFGLQAGDGTHTALILSVNSYERAFAGMLAWETNISDALTTFFTRVPTTVQAADGSLVGNPFEDVVIRNYDVRLLNNPDGTPGLLYAFPNRRLLVITDNPYTLIEVLSRLQAARNL